MHAALDKFVSTRKDDFKKKREAVLTVEGRTNHCRSSKKQKPVPACCFKRKQMILLSTMPFRRTARILSPDIARTYTEVLSKRKDDDDFEASLIEAREAIGALGLLDNLHVFVDSEAGKLSTAWLADYHERIKQLPDDRRETYRQICALSREPQDVDLSLPVSSREATAAREQDGRETVFPKYKQHLLCDEQGLFPAELNPWERKVLRRPSRGAKVFVSGIETQTDQVRIHWGLRTKTPMQRMTSR